MKIYRVCIIVLSALLMLSVSAAAQAEGYIVRLKDNTASHMASSFGDAALFSDLSDSEAAELLVDEVENVDDISTKNGVVIAKDKAALDELVAMGVVEYFEEDCYAELFGYDLTTNPSYASQKWVYDATNAHFVTQAGLFGEGVKVGVIDTGVYPNSDIAANLVEGRNFDDRMTDFDSTDTTDNQSHGTSVASIIAAQCNDKAMVGIAHKVEIVPLKISDNSSLLVSKIISALYAAVDDFDCDVVNLSLGTTTDVENLRLAVNHVIDKGAIIVSAAGNYGDAGYQYPAAYDGVISVANAEKTVGGYRISDSSQKNDKVDIACPGTGVITLSNTASGTVSRNGTSFASPFVAGIAALAKSIDPDLTQAEFHKYVTDTANSSYIASSGQDSSKWGKGMLDVKKLLSAVMKDSNNGIFFTTKPDNHDGKESIYVTNTSSNTVFDFSLVLEEYSPTKLENFKVFTQNLSSFDSIEIPLTDNGFTSGARFRFVTTHVPGDIDNNKEVDLRDVTRLIQILAGWEYEYIPQSLNVNGDGKVDLKDVTRLMQYISGWIVAVQ